MDPLLRLLFRINLISYKKARSTSLRFSKFQKKNVFRSFHFVVFLKEVLPELGGMNKMERGFVALNSFE